MAISLDLLRAFLAVYRAGSVTRAAAVLGLAQPTVTAQIRTLEADLTEALFERRPRGMAPTPAADELARRVAGLLDALEDAVDGDATGQAYRRAVHLGGPPELVCTLAVPDLAGLLGKGVQLRLSFGLAEELLTALGERRLDLVISTVRPRRRDVVAEPLCDEEFVLVAAPSWAGELDHPVSPHALSRVPLVGYAEDLPILRRYWRTVFSTRLTAVPELVIPDLRGVLAAVQAGAGVTVLPRYLCTGALADGSVVALLDPPLSPINTLYLATRAGPVSPAVAAVRTLLLRQGRLW